LPRDRMRPLAASFSIPCSVSDAFQSPHEPGKVGAVAQGVEVLVLLQVRGVLVPGGDRLLEPGHGPVGLGVGLLAAGGGAGGPTGHRRGGGPRGGGGWGGGGGGGGPRWHALPRVV